MVVKCPDKNSKGKTIVYLIRHGDRIHIPGNEGLGLRIPGPGLSPLGKKQARFVSSEAKKIKDEVDVMYCSSMARAIETAEEIRKSINKKPIIVEDLCEFNQFLWKGKIYHPKFWKHYIIHKKSLKAFNKILRKNQGKVVIIVAHGNVIKGFLGKKLGLSFNQIRKLDYDNCHVSKAGFKGKRLEHIHYINSKSLV